MADKQQRKELVAQLPRPVAGVYRYTMNDGWFWLDKTLNFHSVQQKLRFAQTTGMSGAFPAHVNDHVKEYGIDALSVELLDELDITPNASDQDIQNELQMLFALWQQQLGITRNEPDTVTNPEG